MADRVKRDLSKLTKTTKKDAPEIIEEVISKEELEVESKLGTNLSQDNLEKLAIDYLTERGINLENQKKLKIRYITTEEAVNLYFPRNKLSKYGCILFPWHTNDSIPLIGQVRNFYPDTRIAKQELGKNPDKSAKYLSQIKNDELLPYCDQYQYYDPYKILNPDASDPVNGFIDTEDTIGAPRYALEGVRVRSHAGVWLVRKENDNSIKIQRDTRGIWICDSDVLSNGSVFHAVIRTLCYTNKKVCVSSINAEYFKEGRKIGLDELKDAGIDITEFVKESYDLDGFIMRYTKDISFTRTKKDRDGTKIDFAKSILKELEVKFNISTSDLFDRFVGLSDWFVKPVLGDKNYYHFYNLVKTKFVDTDRLRYNELSKEIEVDGSALDLNDFEAGLIHTFKLGIKITEHRALSVFRVLSKENSYNPIKEYLLECKNKYNDPEFLEGLCKKYFGIDDPLIQAYFIKVFALSLVVRTFRPGTEQKEVFMIQGEQNSRKSEFFKVIVPDKFWVKDTFRDITNKDQLIDLYDHAIIEWSELENVFDRNSISAVKNFTSVTQEKLRAPYDRTARIYKRGFVIVGTTNETEVLRDPTGNTRFKIFSLPKGWIIPTEIIPEDRDRFWGTLCNIFLEYQETNKDIRGLIGLTNAETEASKIHNKNYESSDILADDVIEFCNKKGGSVTLSEIAMKVLQVQTPDNKHKTRISKILKASGYNEKVIKDPYTAKTRREWFAPSV